MAKVRPVLEVLKWLSFRDVMEASLTSALWLQCGGSAEVWRQLADDSGLVADSPASFRDGVAASSLCVSRGKQFGVYNSVLGTWQRASIEKKIHFHYSRTSLVLAGAELLICGGTSKHVYTYNLRTQRLRELPPMLRRRQSPGAVTDGLFVYVFGGFHSTYFDSCEKLRLETETWEEMPSMLAARRGVRPCRLHTRILLCGGGPQECEQYDTEQATFSWLPLLLPADSPPVWAVLRGQEVVLLSTKRVSVYDSQFELVWSGEHSVDPFFLCSGMSPVVLGDQLFFSRGWYEIFCFDLRHLALAKIFPECSVEPASFK